MDVKNNSLLSLAIKSVLDNIESYDKNLVNSTIGPVRRDLLEESWNNIKNHSHEHCSNNDEHVNKLWASLPFLIHSKHYVSFDTTDLMQMCRNCHHLCLSNSRFQELVSSFGSNIPNVRSLTINGLSHFTLEERECASMIALKNLEVLRIEDVSVRLSGVVAITQQCEKLEKFNANHVYLDEPSCETFREDFLFVNIIANSFREIDLTMQKTMPIKEFPNCAAFPRYTLLTIDPKEFADFDLLPGLAQVTELRFSSLQLEIVEDEGVEFPTCAELRIARIAVFRSEHLLVRRFLETNGLALRELTLEGISFSDEEFTLGDMFSLCPNLNSLEFIDCDLSGVDAPMEALPRLDKFKWNWEIHVRDLIGDPHLWESPKSCFALDCGSGEDTGSVAYQMRQNQKKFDLVNGGASLSATNAGSQTATFGSDGSSSISASHSGANSNNGQSAANAGSQTATFGANKGPSKPTAHLKISGITSNPGSQSASFGSNGGASLAAGTAGASVNNGHATANAGTQTATFGANGGASLGAGYGSAQAGGGHSAANAGSQTATFGANGGSSQAGSFGGAQAGGHAAATRPPPTTTTTTRRPKKKRPTQRPFVLSPAWIRTPRPQKTDNEQPVRRPLGWLLNGGPLNNLLGLGHRRRQQQQQQAAETQEISIW
ncbi:uncharacterized protein LOC135937436 [Cloeon dipterum]|uniref:uncharacterized protein LOC135937436 n=1 Tax=Cloeon dipterum TaxID=197152 RepID=UPI00321F6806